ncbi:MAG: bifunctional demethylmenaquinone methyltransferase/2-methoxy-6-polyprenyl-1,4-benzoquinol methylase UbiE [Gammaproteobacteria bacterium]|nr:bifunctional demethylmenaquinone methyltransferase/2-methoxy-6-polyprenyl-1,4-benzoquinol methylase UbiE [Gammaproteobacteria bacterium]
MKHDSAESTHFGFESVSPEEKTQRVTQVFESVAARYDLMNDLMSLGIHHIWKWIAVELSGFRKGQTILDLAGGSGDLTRLIINKMAAQGQVILADINGSMLSVGRERLLDKGVMQNVAFVQANAEALPFEERSIDGVIIGFGLRNFTNQMKALLSLYRVCKPGSKLVILEFSQPQNALIKSVYDWYSFQLLPRIGKWVAQDEASYRYLAESIRMHPTPDQLKSMIEQAGFEDCHYRLFHSGIVALHIAYKY